MKNITKLLSCGMLALSLNGCSEIVKGLTIMAETESIKYTNQRNTQESARVDYCAEIDVGIDRKSSPSKIVGDFDGDGDLDYIITVNQWGNKIYSFFLENDGKGNFKLKQYPVKELDINQLE